MDRITVIVPLDGSAASEQAVPMARALAGALHADVQLVYVVEEHAFLDALPRPLLADDVAAQRYLASIAHSLPDAHVTTRVLRGNAAAELLELTRNACSALLVMATHGRGGVGRLVFGSVTDKVVREVAVPVVTVRAAADVTSASAAIPALQTIVVALDGSALAESTLPWATVLAQSTGATVQLVRVNEPIWHAAYLSLAPEAVYLDEAEVAELEARSESGSRAYLDRLAGALRAEGVRVVWETRVGRPADELARSAETSGADLVLLATHGRGGLRRLALGSVMTELMQRMDAPLMILRPAPATTPSVDLDAELPFTHLQTARS